MTLYFDYHVNIGEFPQSTIFNCVEWHQQHPLLAVAIYNPDRGGGVYLCDELGERIREIEPATHPTCQASVLSWHPHRRTLVLAWQNGEIRVWNGDNDFTLVQTPNNSAITSGVWSQQGSKFITVNLDGKISGWRLDARGQLNTLFQVTPSEGMPVAVEMRIAKRASGGVDLAGLAKRAVAGDETALDMFSAWRPKTAGRRTAVQLDQTAFYVATNQGSVYHVNDSGNMRQVLNQLGNIQRMLHHEREDYLLIIVENLNMSYYSIDSTGDLKEVTKAKLSGSANGPCPVTWVGAGILACAVGDVTIRMWEPLEGDSYSLLIPRNEAPHPQSHQESITSIAFTGNKGLLCGCTNSGNVVIWKVNGKGYDAWSQVASTRVKEGIKKAAWGLSHLALNTGSKVFVLREHSLSAVYHDKTSVVQTSASQMLVSVGDETAELNTDLQVSGIALYEETVAAWSGKVMAVYNLVPISSINVIGSFSCECITAGIWDQSIVVLTLSGRVEVLTLQGTVKQYIEIDGQPITLSLTGHFMAVSTITGVLQVWDLSRREAKPHSKLKDLMEVIPDFGEVMMAVCNSNGTKVAFTAASSSLTPMPSIFIWFIDEDNIYSHHFNQSNEPIRFVVSMFWDSQEPRMLVCEARRPNTPSNKRYSASTLARNAPPTTVLFSFLAVQDHGILLRDATPMNEEFISLLNIDLPYFIIIAKSSQKQRISANKILMKDFEGLEDCDVATKNAVINFSFSLTVGDVDQAFKSIRNVKSKSVWSSLARMCVKSRRLDVAKICLGHMGHTRGVAALNEAEKEPEIEAGVAALALQLGMVSEAEKLYTECGRYDLLNKLYQRSDQWDRAVEISQKFDRIHLRNTYHNYGKYMESEGDTEAAAHMYLRAETHRHQVPRMLLESTPVLEKYINQSKDSVLLKWWAQYIEMRGDVRTAMKYYEEAGDQMSLVRVMCHLGDTDRAARLAEDSGDKAAAYYMARRFEEAGRIPEAVHFFTVATAYTNAIRLCKEQGLDDQLWPLALQAGPREQAEAAKFLESSNPDKAVVLYQRAGMFHKALDLAFRINLYDAVESIASDLKSEDDQELLIKCADYFIEQQHFEKAVHLLAVAKQFESAIKLCWEHNVLLNEDLAEKLSPEVGHENRNALLEVVADCALAQANYHLATKKYTQASNKMKAMRALLKSGDTEKIIFFANVSKQKEMYIMAANYLQSLDWRVKPELLKTIISFYTKGKAPHLLANFYIACAQVEVDDYRNYTKALGALNEAAKCLTGAGVESHANLREVINRKTAMVNKFLDAARQFERGDNVTGVEICKTLLSLPLENELVRRGDVFAIMIENTVRHNDLVSAKSLLQQFRKSEPSDNLEFYLAKDILSRLGIEPESVAIQHASDVEDEVIDETI